MMTRMKKNILWFIFSIVVLILSIALLVLANIINDKKPEQREEHFPPDVSINGLESFNFIEDKTIPEIPLSGLGSTGNVILTCYAGTCTEEIEHKQTETNCDEDYDLCRDVEESWTEYRKVIEHYCSKQCFDIGGSKCQCNEPYKTYGTCEKNFYYEKGMVCQVDNIIYFWKGKKYSSYLSDSYSYLDNVIFKDEKCREGTKNCGIIDSNGNELCISSNLKCPINYISEKKLSKDYTSVLIGNKTFYYGNDDTTKRKIIKELVVDSDISLNKDNDKKDILDEYTISGLLEDNKNLYKNMRLGYDPYKEKDIDSKGKSYLRISYTDNNANLTALREKKDLLIFNKTINKKVLDVIEDKTKILENLGSAASVYLIIVFIVVLIYQLKKLNIRNACYCLGSKCFQGFLILIFIGLIITPLIYGIMNYNKAKDAEDLVHGANYSTFKKLNLAFVILGFVLILFLICYIIFIPLTFCCTKPINKMTNNEPNETNNVIINYNK